MGLDVTSDGWVTKIYFPIKFISKCFSVYVTIFNTAGKENSGTYLSDCGVTFADTTGFRGGTRYTGYPFVWFSIGI